MFYFDLFSYVCGTSAWGSSPPPVIGRGKQIHPVPSFYVLAIKMLACCDGFGRVLVDCKRLFEKCVNKEKRNVEILQLVFCGPTPGDRLRPKRVALVPRCLEGS